ncbi:MAG: (d)CMP kinase [Paludibacteraceae bacterium]|nr:(d)CMP kinase [Paludibacteraceae bacterium]
MTKKIIVAVDGYSSCGKSTIAKQLAKYAGYTYIDTGAMYRAVGLWTRRNGLIVGENVDEGKLKANLSNLQLSFHRLDDGTQHIFIGEEDVESQIRTLEASNDASLVSTIGFVRRRMVAMQQQMGEQKGIVMDGRDIGTVVFPNAELKIFVFARPEVRAQRRFLELTQKGEQTTYDEVLKAVEERDYRDTHRAESPLRQAEDAILLDNSDLTPEQQLNKAIELLEKATK